MRGRITYCTGNRNGASCGSGSTGTFSRCSSKVGPEYHGVFADFSTTLSPASADTGISTTASSV